MSELEIKLQIFQGLCKQQLKVTGEQLTYVAQKYNLDESNPEHQFELLGLFVKECVDSIYKYLV